MRKLILTLISQLAIHLLMSFCRRKMKGNSLPSVKLFEMRFSFFGLVWLAFSLLLFGSGGKILFCFYMMFGTEGRFSGEKKS